MGNVFQSLESPITSPLYLFLVSYRILLLSRKITLPYLIATPLQLQNLGNNIYVDWLSSCNIVKFSKALKSMLCLVSLSMLLTMFVKKLAC